MKRYTLPFFFFTLSFVRADGLYELALIKRSKEIKVLWTLS